MEIIRDKNHKTVGGGVDPADTSAVEMLKVDPTTDELLVVLAVESLNATVMTEDKRDQNFVPTVYGISDTDGTTLVPIRTNSDGEILIDNS